ncbi:MAG: hypothetical protein K0Q55_1660 [Verrucomicrobia bacterium]|jgi:hypothetical protein|nr:hypothetical protein [Verrucomicrobiota bacterium]
MLWLKKKPDPLTDRAKELAREIAQLEAEIQKMSARKETARPAVRTTTLPGDNGPVPTRLPAKTVHDPVFENVNSHKLAVAAEAENTSAHYNDLGVRKYDLPALWRRIRNHIYGAPTHSPKLINYLAAGSIHGLRPLRYEKRVGRNRFIFFLALLLAIIWGVVAKLLGH